MIKVLHFVDSLSGGGAERQLQLLLNHWDYKEFKHLIICFNDEGRQDYPDFKIIKIQKQGKYDLCWRQIRKLYRAYNPNILHNWIPATLLYSLPPSSFTGTIYIAGMRSVYRLNSVRRLLQYVLYLWTDYIISNVHPTDMSVYYRKLYQWKSGNYIPNAIYFEKTQKPGTFDFKKDKIYLLFAGRLIKEKNIELLISALVHVAQKFHNIHLLICGVGSNQKSLIDLSSKLGMDSFISFLGYRTDLQYLMAHTDIFILPSFREGMPNVVFEAVKNRMPVIISNIAPHRRWFVNNHNALLFDPKDEDQLAACIVKLIENQTLSDSLIKNAKNLVSALTAENMALQYQKRYTSIYNAGKK